MMPHPDDFDARAFDRRYGTDDVVLSGPAQDKLDDMARVKRAAKAFLDAVEGIDADTYIGGGYELSDVLDALGAAAEIDLVEAEAGMLADEEGDV